MPIVWLIGQARLTPVKFWAIVFLVLLYLIKYTVLHALLFEQTTLTLTESSGGQVAVDASSIKVDQKAFHLNRGSRGSLRAVPAEGYRFKSWTKGCEGADPLCPIEMQADLEVGALFQKTAGLSLEAEGPGRILRGDQVACDTASCSARFDEAEALNFEAMPLGEALFIGWEGGCANKDGPCGMKAGEAPVLKARFKARYPVSFSVEGGGAIEIQDAEFGDCRSGCQRLIPEGSHLQVEAKPHEGLSFLGWEGACSGSDVICHLDVRSPLSAFARFGYRLQLTMEGTGRFEGAGLPPECVGGCDRLLTAGTALELNPGAAQGYRFIGWTGACQGPGPCRMVVQKDLMLHATFLERPRFELKLQVEGGGRIEDAAGALVCASATIGGCRLKVSETTLIARPEEGFRFLGWKGCESQSEPSCTIWLERPRRLTAVFERQAVLMILNEQGPGDIFWREGNLHCPPASSPCQVEVIPGTSVTLEARPREGHQFTGWRGACSDHVPTCSLSPGGPLGVSAYFE